MRFVVLGIAALLLPFGSAWAVSALRWMQHRHVATFTQKADWFALDESCAHRPLGVARSLELGYESWIIDPTEWPQEVFEKKARIVPPSWVPMPADDFHAGSSAQGFGWPFPSLFITSDRRHTMRSGGIQSTSMTSRGALHVRISDAPGDVCVFPLTVLWRGVLANTCAYAMMLFTIFVLPGGFRRWRRRRSGRCEECGYDLAGVSDPCPECGAAITLHPTRASAPPR